MVKTIKRIPLELMVTQTVKVTKGYEILATLGQSLIVALDPEAPGTNAVIRLIEIGEIYDANNLRFIGAVDEKTFAFEWL